MHYTAHAFLSFQGLCGILFSSNILVSLKSELGYSHYYI